MPVVEVASPPVPIASPVDLASSRMPPLIETRPGRVLPAPVSRSVPLPDLVIELPTLPLIGPLMVRSGSPPVLLLMVKICGSAPIPRLPVMTAPTGEPVPLKVNPAARLREPTAPVLICAPSAEAAPPMVTTPVAE